jgi:hypothetical protein
VVARALWRSNLQSPDASPKPELLVWARLSTHQIGFLMALASIEINYARRMGDRILVTGSGRFEE